MGREVGHAERLVGVDEVEAVVRDAGPVRGGRLGRADVEPAEHLPRIGRDDRHGPAARDRSLRRAGSRARSCRSRWRRRPRSSGGAAVIGGIGCARRPGASRRRSTGRAQDQGDDEPRPCPPGPPTRPRTTTSVAICRFRLDRPGKIVDGQDHDRVGGHDPGAQQQPPDHAAFDPIQSDRVVQARWQCTPSRMEVNPAITSGTTSNDPTPGRVTTAKNHDHETRTRCSPPRRRRRCARPARPRPRPAGLGRGHAPTSAPRSAYGPAWSMRTATARPTSAASPARWTSLLPRVRPDSRTPPSAGRVASSPPCPCERSGTTRVDQDLDLTAEPRLVALEADRLLDREQRVEPAALDVGRHVVVEAERRRPGPRRVGRREDLVVADRLEQRQRGLELRLGLAAEPDDHVGRHGDPGHGLADPVEPLAVVLDGVLATHPAQDGVGARLDRQVEVLADRVALGERGDQAVGQVPRVRRHEAQPADRRPAVRGPQPVDRADELGQVGSPGEIEPPAGPALGRDMPEPRLRRQVVAVRVDVLAEQRHLAVARGRQRPRLVDDVVERAAPLRAAAERHDAVGARLVAAVDDRQPRRDRRAARDAPLPDRLGSRARQVVGDADDRAPDGRGRPGRTGTGRPDRRLRRGQPEPVDELGLLVRAQEQVDGRVAAAQPRAIGLADRAAGEHDPHRRVGRLELGELALPADDLLLGALADGAGVDDHQVGVLEGRRLLAAGAQEAAGHLLRVAPVHLAAERPQVEPRQAPGVGQVLDQPRVGRRGGLAGHGGRGSGGAPTAPRSRTSRTGRRRGAVRLSVTAGPWYAEARPGPGILEPWSC